MNLNQKHVSPSFPPNTENTWPIKCETLLAVFLYQSCVPERILFLPELLDSCK